MTALPIDRERYAKPPVSPIVEATLSLLQDAVRRRLAESGGDWRAFAGGAADRLVTREDMEAVERRILGHGHRFDWSAAISARERPDAYKSMAGAEDMAGFSFAHPDAPARAMEADGREHRGVGDNVVRQGVNVVGTARYIRTSARVLAYLQDGVPPGTIAVIDDSGGTLTAPIIEQFAGVVCAGGTVRSHLGILTREYGIACLMNARLSGIRDGDRIEIEATAPAKSAEDYQAGIERTGRIWRLPPEGAAA